MDTAAYLGAFVDEGNELVKRLNDALLRLEKDPKNQKQIEELFRVAHSLKGMSAAMGYTDIANLTHKMENLLDMARKKKREVTPTLIEAMFSCFDVLQILVDDIAVGKESDIDLEPVLERIAEESGSKTRTDKKVVKIRKRDAEAKVLHKKTVRIKASHLDHLVDLVGELVIGKARLEQYLLPLEIPELRGALDNLKAVVTELQQEIMQTRMVPVGNVLHRFSRMVRDTAKELDKDIDFVIEGADIELDKTVLDEIAESIVHLLRNAIGHGMETPKERKKAKKNSQGEVKLVARREKNHVLIEVKDDGRGINVEDVRKCIAKQESWPLKKVKKLTDGEVLQFMCQPGFSMDEETTSLSGRGVGLDAVRGKVEQLGGSVEIKSELGKGSKFTLKLPLTLAIIQALLVKIGEQVLAVPLNNVAEVVSLREQKIDKVQGKEVMVLHGMVVPLLKLREAFSIGAQNKKPLEEAHTVVVETGNRKVALVIDSLVGQREIVIKPLSSMLRGLKGIGGATILGDGKVALILDARGLFGKETDEVSPAFRPSPSTRETDSMKSGEAALPGGRRNQAAEKVDLSKVTVKRGGKDGKSKVRKKSSS